MACYPKTIVENSGLGTGPITLTSSEFPIKLELELIELLKSRRINPISIASLPMIHYERYGRGLQSEVSLTESQQQGEAGYGSTKLQARLRTIRLINRPHGQHPIILIEYVPKYVEVERLRLV